MSTADDSWISALLAHGHVPGAPCADADLLGLAKSLGGEVPQDLRTLYRLGNGVFDEPGQWWIIWPIDRVAEVCSSRWAEDSLPVDLIAFGDDGTGNPFCINRVEPSNVVRWSWIDGAVDTDEGTFADFVGRWIDSPTWPPGNEPTS